MPRGRCTNLVWSCLRSAVNFRVGLVDPSVWVLNQGTCEALRPLSPLPVITQVHCTWTFQVR